MDLPHTVDAGIGYRLQLRRVEKGISQEDLAVALETTTANVQNWENGQLHIEARELQQLAEVLNVPPSFFFESSG